MSGTPSESSAARESWTTRRLREWIRGFLTQRGVDSAAVSTDLLLAHVARCERMHLYMHPDRPWTSDELATLRALVTRAGDHEPVQFLVGSWGFHAGDYEVSPCTLIPRPSTETLVDAALAWIDLQPPGTVTRMIDLGTGTGCIALSVLRALRGKARKAYARARSLRDDDGAALGAADPSAGGLPHAVLTDVVPAAIELARRNAARHGALEHCTFVLGDAWDPIDSAQSFDLVVSNPPYISDAEFSALPINVAKYEPRTALHGGADGMRIVERIVAGAPHHMRPGGLLLVEIAARQEHDAAACAQRAGFDSISVLRDSDDLPRVLHAMRA